MSNDPLAHPDPDIDALATVEPDRLVPADETAASHLVRAILKAEASLKRLEAARQKDVQAWNDFLAAHYTRIEVWRMIVRDWMMRQNLTKIQSPWFTASLATPRTKLVVDDEDRLIRELAASFEGHGLRTKTEVIKAEFQAIYNANPTAFREVAHEEQGEVELRIRKREEK